MNNTQLGAEVVARLIRRIANDEPIVCDRVAETFVFRGYLWGVLNAARSLVESGVIRLEGEAGVKIGVGEGVSVQPQPDSYELLRGAIDEHLGEFTEDVDAAEEFILMRAIELAAAELKLHRAGEQPLRDLLRAECAEIYLQEKMSDGDLVTAASNSAYDVGFRRGSEARDGTR